MWALAGGGLAVLAGVGGCVGLIAKKRWATPLFAASITGIVVQNIYPFILNDYPSIAGPSGAILPAVVLMIAVALLGMSRKAGSSGWLQ